MPVMLNVSSGLYYPELTRFFCDASMPRYYAKINGYICIPDN